MMDRKILFQESIIGIEMFQNIYFITDKYYLEFKKMMIFVPDPHLNSTPKRGDQNGSRNQLFKWKASV